MVYGKKHVDIKEEEVEGNVKDSPVTIYWEWCKGCGICVAFCPKGVLDLTPQGKAYVKNPEKCVRCGLCILRCPDFAIGEGDSYKDED